MDKQVKEFIERNIDLIENNEWEEIYNKIQHNRFSGYKIGEFTQVMLEANINPLDYMDYIPTCYLCESNINGKFIIPNGVERICNYTFSGCRKLTNITIPDSVTSIGYGAFYRCYQLKDIYYRGTKEQWKSIKKEQCWHDNTPLEAIHCTDGDVKLK